MEGMLGDLTLAGDGVRAASISTMSFLDREMSHTELSSIHEELDRQRRRLESNLRDSDAADPLDPYYEYVKFIAEKYPDSEHSTYMPSVIRECLKKFINFKSYYNDGRFIYIFLMDIRTCADEGRRRNMFKVMYKKGIGTIHSRMYIDWAEEMERSGAIDKAHRCFLLAKQNNAEPTDRLNKKYLEFLHRHPQFAPSEVKTCCDKDAVNINGDDVLRSEVECEERLVCMIDVLDHGDGREICQEELNTLQRYGAGYRPEWMSVGVMDQVLDKAQCDKYKEQCRLALTRRKLSQRKLSNNESAVAAGKEAEHTNASLLKLQGHPHVSTHELQDHAEVSSRKLQEHAEVSTHRLQDHAEVSSRRLQEHAEVSTHRLQDHAEVSSRRLQEHAEVSASKLQEHTEISSHRLQEHAEVSAHGLQENAEASPNYRQEHYDEHSGVVDPHANEVMDDTDMQEAVVPTECAREVERLPPPTINVTMAGECEGIETHHSLDTNVTDESHRDSRAESARNTMSTPARTPSGNNTKENIYPDWQPWRIFSHEEAEKMRATERGVERTPISKMVYDDIGKLFQGSLDIDTGYKKKISKAEELLGRHCSKKALQFQASAGGQRKPLACLADNKEVLQQIAEDPTETVECTAAFLGINRGAAAAAASKSGGNEDFKVPQALPRYQRKHVEVSEGEEDGFGRGASGDDNNGCIPIYEDPSSEVSEERREECGDGNFLIYEDPPSTCEDQGGGQISIYEDPPSTCEDQGGGQISIYEDPPSTCEDQGGGQIPIYEDPPSTCEDQGGGQIPIYEDQPSPSDGNVGEGSEGVFQIYEDADKSDEAADPPATSTAPTRRPCERQVSPRREGTDGERSGDQRFNPHNIIPIYEDSPSSVTGSLAGGVADISGIRTLSSSQLGRSRSSKSVTISDDPPSVVLLSQNSLHYSRLPPLHVLAAERRRQQELVVAEDSDNVFLDDDNVNQPQAQEQEKLCTNSSSSSGIENKVEPIQVPQRKVVVNSAGGNRWSRPGRKTRSEFLSQGRASRVDSLLVDYDHFRPQAQSTGTVPASALPPTHKFIPSTAALGPAASRKLGSGGTSLETCFEESELKYDEFHPSCSSTSKIPTDILLPTFYANSRTGRKETADDVSDRFSKNCAVTTSEPSQQAHIVPVEILANIRDNACRHYEVCEGSVPHIKVRCNFTANTNPSTSYNVKSLVAEGAFGRIYLTRCDATDEMSIIKVVDKRLKPFEAYIMNEIKTRSDMVGRGIGDVSQLFGDYLWVNTYDDGYVLSMPYYADGTLLTLLNRCIAEREDVHEKVMSWWTHQLLDAVNYLHHVGIIHMDIKVDNIMMQRGHDGDAIPRLIIIDFGSAIDLKAIDEYYTSSESETSWLERVDKYMFDYQYKSQEKCPRMQSGRMWKYEQDYYGVLSALHVVMFSCYMNVVESRMPAVASGSESNGTVTYSITKVPKRKWVGQSQWRSLVHGMLNPSGSGVNLQHYRDTFKQLHDDIPNTSDYNRNLLLINRLLQNK